MHKYQMVLS